MLPFIAAGDASNATQQKPATNAQTTSTVAPGMLKFIVTVTSERGSFITGLTRDSFDVFEGKSEREITYFYDDPVPASVGILVDVSDSMRKRVIEAAKSAAIRFVERGHPENEYFISEFESSARELTGWTRDREKIVAALNSVPLLRGSGKKPKPRGLTALYDTGIAALEKVSQGTNPKRLLLVINDAGGDNDSKRDFSALRRKIRETDVLVYGIGIRERIDDFSGIPGDDILDEMTAVSGGRAYFPVLERKELDEVVDRLTIELQHQYIIGFTPANAAQGGKWNKVKVKMSPSNERFKKMTVRSRDGYFSPPISP